MSRRRLGVVRDPAATRKRTRARITGFQAELAAMDSTLRRWRKMYPPAEREALLDVVHRLVEAELRRSPPVRRSAG